VLRPDVLLTGAAAVSTRLEAGDDELLANQTARLDRKIDSVATERRRVADLYQANFIEREELLRRGHELERRHRALDAQRRALVGQREQLAQHNMLRDRVEGFADKVNANIDRLIFASAKASCGSSLKESASLDGRLKSDFKNPGQPTSDAKSGNVQQRPFAFPSVWRMVAW
jgi:hypothetical protein